MDGEAITNAYASNLNSGGNLNIDVGSAVVVASNINAGESLNIQTDISDIDILSATETVSTKSHSKEMKISFGDVLKGFADLSDMVKVEDGQLKFSLASATYDEVDVKTERTSQHGSTLSANNNLTLDSIADINIEGSDLFADVNGSNASADNTVNNALNNGSINLFAGGDVSITEAEESYKEVTKEIHGTGEVSLVVQNQAVEVVKAASAVNEAKDGVKQANKDYKDYKKERDGLEGTLAQLESEYESGAAGVTYTDIIELRDLLDDVKDDEDWYIAGVTLATANLGLIN